MNELKYVIDEKSLKTLYYGNFHSLLAYGVIFWGDSINADKIFVLQKRVLRTMLKLYYLEHCKEYFKIHKILPLPCVYILDCVTFVKKNYTDLFEEEKVMYEYNTRYKNKNLILPKTRLKLVDNGPFCKCVQIYNKLPNEHKIIENVVSFRNVVKALLLRHCFYSV